jgi:hypothetical protein
LSRALWLPLAAALLIGFEALAQGAPPESGGVTGLTSSGTAITATVPYLAPGGSCAAPTFAWQQDADGTGSGWWRQAANVWSLCLNGVEIFRFSGTELRLLNSAALWTGTVRDPNGNQQLFFSTVSGSSWSNQAAGTVNPIFSIENTNAVTTGVLLRLRSGGSNHFEVTATDVKTAASIYLQGAHGATAPAAGECDNDSERNRQYLDHTVSPRRLYICTGAANGWDHIALTD